MWDMTWDPVLSALRRPYPSQRLHPPVCPYADVLLYVVLIWFRVARILERFFP